MSRCSPVARPWRRRPAGWGGPRGPAASVPASCLLTGSAWASCRRGRHRDYRFHALWRHHTISTRKWKWMATNFWNNNNILYLHLPDYKYEKYIKECWPRKFDTECLDVMMTLSQSVTETLNDLQSLSTPKDPNSLTHFVTEMHKNYV